jgi:hypothetical protein
MLFRPVYGPELTAVHACIVRKNEPVSRQEIYDTVLSVGPNGGSTSTQNVDDALSFLVAAHLISGSSNFRAAPSTPNESFRLHILRKMQALNSGEVEALHEIDRLYVMILDHLFIKPNKLYIADLHSEANKLRLIAQVGGISHEKIRSWKRVMTFLGLGRCIGQGFQCVYSPQLMLEVIGAWKKKKGFIQIFLEEHLGNYLPFQASTGNLSLAIQQPLLHLLSEGKLKMVTRQDSSFKPYFGPERLRYIVRIEEES